MTLILATAINSWTPGQSNPVLNLCVKGVKNQIVTLKTKSSETPSTRNCLGRFFYVLLKQALTRLTTQRTTVKQQDNKQRRRKLKAKLVCQNTKQVLDTHYKKCYIINKANSNVCTLFKTNQMQLLVSKDTQNNYSLRLKSIIVRESRGTHTPMCVHNSTFTCILGSTRDQYQKVVFL